MRIMPDFTIITIHFSSEQQDDCFISSISMVHNSTGILVQFSLDKNSTNNNNVKLIFDVCIILEFFKYIHWKLSLWTGI